MIKNFLYSLLFHALLFLLIYTSFNLTKIDENESEEITVSLAVLTPQEQIESNLNNNNLPPSQGLEKTEEIKPEEVPAPEPVKEEKPIEKPLEKPKPKKSSAVPKAKEAPAKSKPKAEAKKPLEKPKPAKSAVDSKEEKSKDFKPKEPENKNQEKVENKQENKKLEEKIDDLINSLQDETADAGETEAGDEPKAAETMANSIENLNLSAREKYNIQSQLKRCYKKALDEIKVKTKIIIVIKANISKEGYITSNLEQLIDRERYNDKKDFGYKNAIDSVHKAIELCSPLRNLPLDKYDIWKEVTLEFDEDELE